MKLFKIFTLVSKLCKHQNARSKNLTHKMLMAETWMEAYFKRIGDKMCDTGALHLPSFLDKTIIYGYLKAERKDEDENVIHYSTFCYLLRNVFPFVKIPKEREKSVLPSKRQS